MRGLRTDHVISGPMRGLKNRRNALSNAAPLIGKKPPFSNMAVSFELMMHFKSPSGFRKLFNTMN